MRISKQFIFCITLLLFFTSCLRFKNSEHTTIHIRTNRETNRGTSLYVMVKETTIANFLLDDYNKIASQMFVKEDEKTYLTKKVIIPGLTHKIVIEKPNPEKSLGVYFIFTHPEEGWKCIVNDPLSKKIDILLGKDQCQSVDIY